MKSPKILPLFTLFFSFLIFQAKANETYTIKSPKTVLTNIPFKLTIQPSAKFYSIYSGQTVKISVTKIEPTKVLVRDSVFIDIDNVSKITLTDIRLNQTGKISLLVSIENITEQIKIRVIPSFLSILPPLLAILLALITRQVIIALFFGIWIGVTFIYDYNLLIGFLHTLDEYIINTLTEPNRVSILIFSLVLGGMVGVITRSGGTQGIVEKLSRYAKNPKLGQLATWTMGIFIFFDDYANTLIVGNTMRPLVDKLRISREKLSYLVDSTAAPVANIAIISTWIGYEISLINQSFTNLGVTENAYIVFLKTIPYNFYPIYTLVFGFFIAYLLRDFGSMYQAEIRTRQTGAVLKEGAIPVTDLTSTDLMAEESTPLRWFNAFIPIMSVILSVILGLIYTGYQNSINAGLLKQHQNWIRQISLIVGNADSFSVLMWASFIGSITAILLVIGQRILNIQQAMEAWVKGIRAMIMAAIILTSAWAIGAICQDLYTADYVIHLTRKFLTPHWLPLVTFLTAAIISFATGTSWGTMAILMPIAIPLSFKFPLEYTTIDQHHAIILILSTTASVLAGATFGDHCSPISDTTIMSSMSSGADHIDHVRTQLPYAMTAGVIACIFGYIPVGFDITGWWILIPGVIATYLIIRFLGKKTN